MNAAAKTIQIKIEQEISAKKSTEWLRQAIESFVKEQDQWNTTTENYTLADHLQGGALLYVNNDKTPWQILITVCLTVHQVTKMVL